MCSISCREDIRCLINPWCLIKKNLSLQYAKVSHRKLLTPYVIATKLNVKHIYHIKYGLLSEIKF